MPRAKSAVEKVLDAWKGLEPAEKTVLFAVLKSEVEVPKARPRKASGPRAVKTQPTPATMQSV